MGRSVSDSSILSAPSPNPERSGAITMSRYVASSGASMANVPAEVTPRSFKYLRTSVPAPAASATASKSILDSQPQAGLKLRPKKLQTHGRPNACTNVSNAITEHVTQGLHGPHTHGVNCTRTRTSFFAEGATCAPGDLISPTRSAITGDHLPRRTKSKPSQWSSSHASTPPPTDGADHTRLIQHLPAGLIYLLQIYRPSRGHRLLTSYDHDARNPKRRRNRKAKVLSHAEKGESNWLRTGLARPGTTCKGGGFPEPAASQSGT